MYHIVAATAYHLPARASGCEARHQLGRRWVHLASSGIAYCADRDFSGGNTWSNSGAIDGTVDDNLYQTERNSGSGSSFSYALPVTVGKSYRITIKLAEIWRRVDNVYTQRIFHILVEDNMAFESVDIFDAQGGYTALDLEHTYVAGDDTLDIKFNNFLQKAKVSAILVEELSLCSNDGQPTGSPTKQSSNDDGPSPTPAVRCMITFTLQCFWIVMV